MERDALLTLVPLLPQGARGGDEDHMLRPKMDELNKLIKAL